VTNKRLCFRSFFNDKTLFGKGTRVFILYQDLVTCEKKCYGGMKMFPNSIALQVRQPSGTTVDYFFTSMMYASRNKGFALITSLAPHLRAPRQLSQSSTVLVDSDGGGDSSTEYIDANNTFGHGNLKSE
jgi:hypothetical protein